MKTSDTNLYPDERLETYCRLLRDSARGTLPPGTYWFTSFDRRALVGMKRLAPDLFTGLLTSAPPTAELIQEAKQLGCGRLSVPIDTTSRKFARDVRKAGLQLSLWPIRTLEDANLAVMFGASIICTDIPSQLLGKKTAMAAAAKGVGAAFASSTSSAGLADLPFDREVINRYSLDHLPRSLSIRQGKDVWLGYDLERGKPYKVWQAPAGQPGLITTGFVTRSAGTAWYEDPSSETWQLRREGNTVPLAIRYLGCSQREGGFELTWELRHDGGALKLVERVSRAAAPDTERVKRELRVESLAAGEVLLPPLPAREAWKLAGGSAAAFSGPEWHRLTLP